MQEQEDTSTFSEENLISVTVNGHLYEQRVPVRMLLSDFLRHELHLTGTHVGCEHGVCGCCTVLLNGEAVGSSLQLAGQTHRVGSNTPPRHAGAHYRIIPPQK